MDQYLSFENPATFTDSSGNTYKFHIFVAYDKKRYFDINISFSRVRFKSTGVLFAVPIIDGELDWDVMYHQDTIKKYVNEECKQYANRLMRLIAFI